MNFAAYIKLRVISILLKFSNLKLELSTITKIKKKGHVN